MSTRRASSPTAFSYEKFMSAPELAELRALPGNLIAAKTQLYPDKCHRELLLWLQAVSLNPGGIKQLARDIVSKFPHCLGTFTMHQCGVKQNAIYTQDQMELIKNELDLPAFQRFRQQEQLKELVAQHGRNALFDEESNYSEIFMETGALACPENSAKYLLEVCTRLANSQLADFLRNLCLDPDIDLEALEEDDWHASAPYINRLWTILQQFQAEAETIKAHTVITSIGKAIGETLDHALNTRRMVVIEGVPGLGKSHGARAWAERHPAKVRYITLSGITHRTGFFQKIASVIGLATCQRKANELQAAIEAFFAKTKMMLVIDEAAHLFPKSLRVATAPELVDWINTALVDQGAPVGLVCTDQFARLKERCEKRTGWTSEQLQHRIKRYKKLPDAPTEDDLHAVATSLLGMHWSESLDAWVSVEKPKVERDAVQIVVGYALTSRLPMAAVRDAIDESRVVAREAGRISLCADDVQKAILGEQIPSDAAMKTAFEFQGKQQTRESKKASVGRNPQRFVFRAQKKPAPLSPPKAFTGPVRGGISSTTRGHVLAEA